MSETSPIVVGVDFSDPARRAVEVATAVSERLRAPIVLLHAWNAHRLIGSGKILPQLHTWVAEQRAELTQQLEEWTHAARNIGVTVTSRVVEGVASRVIPDEARSLGAGLVVVGRRGSANLSHVLLGSVSERVVHQASCPVLVVPGSSVGGMPARFLVGVDFSQGSKDAVDVALRFAEQLGAAGGLVLAHVRPSEHALFLESGIELAYAGEYPYDLEALERWGRPPVAHNVRLDCQILEGKAEEALVRAAQQEGCDWLILGLQGRTALAAFLVGSTTDRILKLSDRPVLVVRMTSSSPGESTG